MKKKNKRFLSKMVSGGLLATAFFISANTVFAQTPDTIIQKNYKQSSGLHMSHKWNSDTKAVAFASKFGLDGKDVKIGLKSGKSLKQILKDNNITFG